VWPLLSSLDPGYSKNYDRIIAVAPNCRGRRFEYNRTPWPIAPLRALYAFQAYGTVWSRFPSLTTILKIIVSLMVSMECFIIGRCHTGSVPPITRSRIPGRLHIMVTVISVKCTYIIKRAAVYGWLLTRVAPVFSSGAKCGDLCPVRNRQKLATAISSSRGFYSHDELLAIFESLCLYQLTVVIVMRKETSERRRLHNLLYPEPLVYILF
jgi:hypothetical protein